MIIFLLSRKLGGGNLVLQKFCERSDLVVASTVVDHENISFENSIELFKFRDRFRNVFYVLSAASFFIFRIFYLRKRLTVTHNFFLLPLILLPRYFSRRVIFLAQDLDFEFFSGLTRYVMLFSLRRFAAAGGRVETSSQLLCDRYAEWGIPSIINPRLNRALYNFCDSICDNVNTTSVSKHYDFIFLIRNGRHKNPLRTIQYIQKATDSGYEVLVINFGNFDLSSLECTVVGCQPRPTFLRMLQSSRAFVCLSTWEGFGLPNVEAAALGLDVFSTEIPSVTYLRDVGYQHLYSIERLEEILNAQDYCDDVFW